MHRLSVIICTHNPREDYLRRTLGALHAQTLSLDEWELLLVDNASTTPLASRVDLSWHPCARQLREEKVGKLHAWLLGIKEARADILVFVDDDNVLNNDFLEKTLQVGTEWPFIGAWGGAISPEYEQPLPPWVRDQVWRLTVVEVKKDIWSNLREGYATVPVGAGLCVRRAVAQKYWERCHSNSLCTQLDRSGSGLAGYGDIDLAYCAFDLGLGTGKSTKLHLIHLIPARRLSLDYFTRHAEGDASSMMLFRASRGLPIQAPKPATWIGTVRWFLHRLIHRVPHEQYEIAKAHQRGLEKGYDIVSKLLGDGPK